MIPRNEGSDVACTEKANIDNTDARKLQNKIIWCVCRPNTFSLRS